MMADLVMMIIGVVSCGVGVVATRSVTAASLRRRQESLLNFQKYLTKLGAVEEGIDFISGLPTAAQGRVKLLRPRACRTGVDGAMCLRYLPAAMGADGVVNIALGVDGVVVEVVINGVSATRHVTLRVGPHATVDDAFSEKLRRVSSGAPGFDRSFAIQTDAPEVVHTLTSQTALLDVAREIFAHGGVVIDGVGGVLRVVGVLPLDVTAVEAFGAMARRAAEALSIEVGGLRLGIGGVGGSSGSPFALPSG